MKVNNNGFSVSDWMKELERLGTLKDKGLLTEEEFLKEKEDVLKRRDISISNEESEDESPSPSMGLKGKDATNTTVQTRGKESSRFPKWIEDMVKPQEDFELVKMIFVIWSAHCFFNLLLNAPVLGDLYMEMGIPFGADMKRAALKIMDFNPAPMAIFIMVLVLGGPLGLLDMGVFALGNYMLGKMFKGKGTWNQVLYASTLGYALPAVLMAVPWLTWIFAGDNLLDEPSGFFWFIDSLLTALSSISGLFCYFLAILALSRAHEISYLKATVCALASSFISIVAFCLFVVAILAFTM